MLRILSSLLDNIGSIWRIFVVIIVPLLLLPLPFIVATQESKCGYVILVMAVFFMTEPIPLAVTALIPVILFPLFGVLTTSETCTPYMKDTIMMYIGGLTIAAAVEHCNLHKRIALKVLLTIGTGVRWLMLGFMLTTMFLSMWISNTATTAMMVPIVDAVLLELKKNTKEKENAVTKEEFSTIFIPMQSRDDNSKEMDNTNLHVATEPNSKLNPSSKEMSHNILTKALFLSVAYAANCGGTGSLIGSGPNLVLKGYVEEIYPKSTELTYASWMLYNVPAMLICVTLSWIGLQLMYIRCCQSSDSSAEKAARSVIQKSYEELGSMSFHEFAVLVLFIILVFLWFLREPQFIPGWASLFPYGMNIKDATPAIAVCIFLYIIPAKPTEFRTSPPLLDWKTCQRKVPWGVLLLLGSGFAVADAAKKSGLSVWIGSQLSGLRVLSPQVILLILVLITSSLTEVVSNMSITTIVLPVINEMAVTLHIHPLYFLLPVTIVCSFAFMLPVGNPSNAIVFDSSNMSTFDMVKAGFILKFVCCGVELALINTLGYEMFNFGTYPSWAEVRNSENQSMTSLFFNGTEKILT